jgi:hypothetical protein
VTRSIALLLGIAAAIAVWLGAPFVRPDIGAVWFIGADEWRGVLLHGREIVTVAAGLVVWILALHVSRRGRIIAGIRLGARARASSLSA